MIMLFKILHNVINHKEITAAFSTLISQYIIHCVPATQQLQELIKEFYFYIVYTKSRKFVDFPGNVALQLKNGNCLDSHTNLPI